MRAPHLLQDQEPGDVALHYAETTFSFGDLDERSRRVATALRGLGLGPGDRVAIWLPNTPAWLEVFFACCRIGAIAVSVNTRFRSSEVEDILFRSQARLLVLWPRFLNIDFLEVAEGSMRSGFTTSSASSSTRRSLMPTDRTERPTPGELWGALASHIPLCWRPSQNEIHRVHPRVTSP